MWSNLSILQPHYKIITKLINPLNCTLPPSDMHQCVSDYVWPLPQYSPALSKLHPVVIPRFPPFHHLGLIIIIIFSLSISSSVFFISLFLCSFPSPPPSAHNSTPLRPPFLKHTPTIPSLRLIRITMTTQEVSRGPGGQWQRPPTAAICSFPTDWHTPSHYWWSANGESDWQMKCWLKKKKKISINIRT